MIVLKVGDTVKFIDGLYADEINQRYTIIELNGDRCIIVAIDSTLSFPPTSIAKVAELELA